MKINLSDLPKNKYFVGLTKEFNDELVDKFKKKFKPFSRNTKNILNIRATTLISCYKKRQYPLSLLEKILVSMRLDLILIQKNVTYIKTSGASNLINPTFPIELSKELARIISHLLGDGHLNVYKETIKCAYYNQEKTLIKNFKKDLSKVFNVDNLYVGINKNTPFVLVPSSAAWILSRLIKNFSSHTARTPLFIKQSSESIKREFLKSFLDDEAHVRYKPPNRNIEIALSNKLLLNDINDLLKEFGIDSSRTHHKNVRGFDIYYFYIGGYHNLKNYYDSIGFSHPKKRESLKRIMDNPGRKSFSRGETEEKILIKLKLGINTSTELGKQLNRKRVTINHFLWKLEQRNKIERVVFRKTGTIWKIKENTK